MKRNETTYTERPKMAICYDFDRTLSPDDMQTFTLIPSFGVNKEEFWHESDNLARDNLMDNNLAWMYELIKYSKFHGKSLRREYFKEIGADVQLYEGVEEWFRNVEQTSSRLFMKYNVDKVSIALDEDYVKGLMSLFKNR